MSGTAFATTVSPKKHSARWVRCRLRKHTNGNPTSVRVYCIATAKERLMGLRSYHRLAPMATIMSRSEIADKPSTSPNIRVIALVPVDTAQSLVSHLFYTYTDQKVGTVWLTSSSAPQPSDGYPSSPQARRCVSRQRSPLYTPGTAPSPRSPGAPPTQCSSTPTRHRARTGRPTCCRRTSRGQGASA